MSPLEVRKVARKTAQKAIAVQKKEFKSFALMCDWDQVYQTFGSLRVAARHISIEHTHDGADLLPCLQIRNTKSGNCASSKRWSRKVRSAGVFCGITLGFSRMA